MTDDRLPSNDALARLGLPSQRADAGYPPTSRYAGIEMAITSLPDQGQVVYLRRRWLPMGSEMAELERYVVNERDRLDLISARRLGDPEQWWRIADANDALVPSELEESQRELRITLPEGIPGAPDAP
jgi:nucleoid-associated protein YgaU